jgi:DNA-binding MarR family transcriptional regulator
MVLTEDLDRALELLHFGFRRVVELPDAILGKRGLSRVHHRILYFVRKRGPLTHAELGQILDVSKQALHGPLRQLLRQKLVAVHPSELDRRQRMLTLTARGRELEEKMSGIQRDLFRIAFATAGRRSEASFRAVMQALAHPPV